VQEHVECMGRLSAVTCEVQGQAKLPSAYTSRAASGTKVSYSTLAPDHSMLLVTFGIHCVTSTNKSRTRP
jgi:hypothetical protein